MVHQRVHAFALIGVYDLTGGLIKQKNVFIFVNDAQLRRGNGQVNVLLAGRLKEFIVDIALEDVSLAELLFARGARTVYFDALQPDVFLRQRGGEQRDRLAEKAVEPLSGVVLPIWNSRMNAASVCAVRDF